MKSLNHTEPLPFPACRECSIRPDRRDPADGPRASVECPVRAVMGLFGWPCFRTQAEVMAAEADDTDREAIP